MSKSFMDDTSIPRVGDIVTKWRERLSRQWGMGKPISQRRFARKLSEVLYPHGSISYATVRNWETGAAIPPYWFLVAVYLTTAGWTRNFALEMLARLRPNLWGEKLVGVDMGLPEGDSTAYIHLVKGNCAIEQVDGLEPAGALQIAGSSVPVVVCAHLEDGKWVLSNGPHAMSANR